MKIEMTVEEFKELMEIDRAETGTKFEFESSVDCYGLTLEKAVEGLKKIDLPQNSKVKVRYDGII